MTQQLPAPEDVEGRPRHSALRLTSDVLPGATSATPSEGTVVFLIGMRVNRWWRPDQWLPTFRSAFPMLKEVHREADELGFLGMHVWFGRTTLMLQYWESMEALLAYARSAEATHVPGWRDFNRRVGADPSVGVWHEAYVTSPDRTHVVYRNMPPFGLGRVTEMVPGRLHQHRPADTSSEAVA